MKTITTQNIDGIEIITRIGNVDGLVDPVATKAAIAVLIVDTDVHKDIEKIKKQMSVYARQAHEAMKHAGKAQTQGDKDKFVTESKARRLQFDEEQEKLLPLAKEYKKLYSEMMVGPDAKYFTPKPGEEIIEDSDAVRIGEKMQAATEAGKLLARDESEVDNFKGKTFWKLDAGIWDRIDITVIGTAPIDGAIADKDLTGEQRTEIVEQLENERIAALKPIDKDAEKNAMIDGLVARAGAMKNELEVLGDKDALIKAQTWLADEQAVVEARYQ